jgi:hypothetical protein
MTDQETCRDHALHCIDMANNAANNVRMQRALFDMAKTWLKLADQAGRIEAPNGSASPILPASSPRPF